MGKGKRIKEGRKMAQEQDKARATQLLTELREIAARNKTAGSAVAGISNDPNDYNPTEFREDLNQLPLPDTQEVLADGVFWQWCIEDEYTVEAKLFTRGPNKGNYEVTQSECNKPMTAQLFASNYAKRLGQALISASNYRDVWKLHAGTFMERALEAEVEGLQLVKEVEKDNPLTVAQLDNMSVGEKEAAAQEFIEEANGDQGSPDSA